MEDFTADNAKIDAVLGDHTVKLNNLAVTSPKHGNCQIYTTSYGGDDQCGASRPNTLTFPKKPELITIYTPNSLTQFNIFPQDITYGYSSPTRDYTVHITWTGNTVSWYANYASAQMNSKSYTYHVIAFCPLD